MKDRRPNGSKKDGTPDYNWNVPNKRGWYWKAQLESMEERKRLRFKGKPQSKNKLRPIQ